MSEIPQAAAALILSREDRARVLMIRRNPALRFMGGHHAFPGGRIDPGEGSERVVGAPNGDEARAIHAVAREAFEETGLLLTRGTAPNAESADRARRELLAGRGDFDAFLAEFGLTIHADDLEPAGLWVTPALSPIRFHTRYYVHRRAEAAGESLIPGEVDDVAWQDPAAMRRRWRAGEVRISPPIAYVLDRLARRPYPEVMESLRCTSHCGPADPGRMEFAAGVHMIPLLTPTIPPATHTNCVAVGERELYLIDPSTPHAEERERLVAQVDCLLEFGGRVAAILLTHAHADHVGAAEFARDRFGAPIGAHAITAERLDFQVDRRLEDGEVIAIPGDPDWRLRCVLTPGHDPGHLCFFEETTRTLIAGDMVAERGTIAILPDDGGDMTAYLESLEKLRALDADQIIPGHGFIIADPEAKLRAYIDHRLAREKKIESALARGLTRIEDLLPVAYDDVDLKLWKWAEQSLRAHLARIESKNS